MNSVMMVFVVFVESLECVECVECVWEWNDLVLMVVFPFVAFLSFETL